MTAAATGQREAFEKFAINRGVGVTIQRGEDGEYIDRYIWAMWIGWQAAQAQPTDGARGALSESEQAAIHAAEEEIKYDRWFVDVAKQAAAGSKIDEMAKTTAALLSIIERLRHLPTPTLSETVAALQAVPSDLKPDAQADILRERRSEDEPRGFAAGVEAAAKVCDEYEAALKRDAAVAKSGAADGVSPENRAVIIRGFLSRASCARIIGLIIRSLTPPAADTDEAMVERVARAICKSRTCEGVECCQWPANGGRTKCPVKAGGYDDAARAAIAAMRQEG